MGKIKDGFYKKTCMLVFAVCIGISIALPVKAEGVPFTPEEEAYLAEGRVLKAVSIDGGAPLHYRDSKGEIKGIAVNVLKEISDMTGIVFEYYLYDSIDHALKSDFDVVFGLSKQYTRPGIALSTPYLESETVLYYHKSLDPSQLGDKTYAGIQGGSLPEGVAEQHAVYFNSREPAIDAVDAGKADYGFGNAYSVAFYTLQNGYTNIYTIPVGKEDRVYCMGIPEENKTLLSIINKSLGSIDKSRMDTLILDVASQVERKITFPIIMDAYGKEIFSLIAFIMLLLTYFMLSSMRAKNQYKMENRRHRLLSKLSNEYLFEYRIKTDHLEAADKIHEKIDLDNHGEKIKDLLKRALKELDEVKPEKVSYTIKLPLNRGGDGTFRVLFSYLRDEIGRIHSLIGELVDISEEEKEKERLIARSQLDGLTGLYNAVATKEAIVKSIRGKGAEKIDALLIIDCDKLKEINDTYGHLMGDEALKNISGGLKHTFRQSDIIGRIGGDEFCVYMRDIPSAEFVRSKCQQLADRIRESIDVFPTDISVGVSVLREPVPYESLFKQADDALYAAKGNGGAQVIIKDNAL